MIRQTPHKQASLESPCEKLGQHKSCPQKKPRSCTGVNSHSELVQYKMHDMWDGHKAYTQYGDLHAECNKLKATTFSVLEPNLNLWHHIHHNNYYNTVVISESKLSRNIMVCGTISYHRVVIPANMLKDGRKLNIVENKFCQRNRMLTHLWNNKW